MANRGLHRKLSSMPRAYSAEFRARAIALVPASKPAKDIAFKLGIQAVTLPTWTRQGDTLTVPVLGFPSQEFGELRLARRRIRKLEQELRIVRTSAKLLHAEEPVAPIGSTRMPAAVRDAPGLRDVDADQ